ncbi:MAG: DUF2252 domain-containing protein [Acidimicrobiia bacterium]|nr:DUF2252 domain-containing protein [Acidimicrobiia bacterium]
MTTADERYQQGKALRAQIPRSSHSEFTRSPDVDPVEILTGQDEGRLQALVPVRHARMGENPFAFYRAGAKLMATDLSTTPTTNLMAQLSGDAHLSNFGWFGSPERQLVFDANDFDETLPGSFEWDVKRMAASFVIAAQNNGFDADEQEAAAFESVRAYRDAMRQFAAQGYLDVWYLNLSSDKLYATLESMGKKKRVKKMQKGEKKARSKDSEHALKKLGVLVDGRYQIENDPPFVVRLEDLAPDLDPSRRREIVEDVVDHYTSTVPDHLEVLLSRYDLLDFALKVVGVGSVGTRCYIGLLQGRDQEDPLFLQVKEAGDSALAEFFPPSQYEHAGERVVQGQRLMQSSTDIFLGWATGFDGTQYYVRQLKDMKYSVEVEDMGPNRLRRYAHACAAVLAQSHARSGSTNMIAGYMGSGDVFPRAVAEFGMKYAEQNDADYQAFATQVGFPSVEDASQSALSYEQA